MWGLLFSQVGWLAAFVILLSSLIPITTNFAKVETASLIGGYVQEGEYVGINCYGEEVTFSVDKDNHEEDSSPACTVYIDIGGKEIKHTLYYSCGILHLYPYQRALFDQPGNKKYAIRRDHGVYSVYEKESSREPYLTFVRENDKSAYKRMID